MRKWSEALARGVEKIVLSYRQAVHFKESTSEEVLRDLLTDLMHYAESMDIDFEIELDRARKNFEFYQERSK